MVKKLKIKNDKKKGKSSKNFEIQKIKKLIKKELYSNYTMNNKKSPQNIFSSFIYQNKPEEKQEEYYIKYTKYMSEEFNSRIVNMFIIYIKSNKSFPVGYQKEPNFINKFINLIKRLLMNELELSFFTILLDKMGWSYPEMDHWIYFCILGIFSKKLLGNEEESALLIDILSNKNTDLLTYYTTINEEEVIKNYEENSISIKKTNERFRQLTRPINSYCRHNFIYYNGVVDKIVKWSQPYGAESNGNQLNNDEFNLNNNNELNNDLPSFKEGKIIENLNNDNCKNFMINNNNNSIYYNPLNPMNSYFNNNLQMLQSNDFNEQGRNYTSENNSNLIRYNINEMNFQNNYMYNLNLANKPSSQYSLKSEKNIPNSNINNFN